MTRILSPMPRGSGAIVVHRQLQARISGYRVWDYHPLWELAPFLLPALVPTGADLIHTAPDHAIYVARSATPLVVTFHNYVLDPFMQRYSSPAQRLHYRTDLRWSVGRALQRADAITAVSRFTADLVRAQCGYAGEIRVISNGVDASVFYPRGGARHNDPVRVLFSGNLTARKGAPLLPLIAGHLDAGVVIRCTTGLRSGSSLAAVGNIEDIGRIAHADMPQVYAGADMLLLPTVREGMSLAVLEAMACGLPVVASDCSSLPELIHHGRGGFLCPLGDTEAFAGYINQLAASPERRSEMGQYNRDLVLSRFTVQRMVSAYEALFEEML